MDLGQATIDLGLPAFAFLLRQIQGGPDEETTQNLHCSGLVKVLAGHVLLHKHLPHLFTGQQLVFLAHELQNIGFDQQLTDAVLLFGTAEVCSHQHSPTDRERAFLGTKIGSNHSEHEFLSKHHAGIEGSLQHHQHLDQGCIRTTSIILHELCHQLNVVHVADALALQQCHVHALGSFVGEAHVECQLHFGGLCCYMIAAVQSSLQEIAEPWKALLHDTGDAVPAPSSSDCCFEGFIGEVLLEHIQGQHLGLHSLLLSDATSTHSLAELGHVRSRKALVLLIATDWCQHAIAGQHYSLHICEHFSLLLRVVGDLHAVRFLQLLEAPSHLESQNSFLMHIPSINHDTSTVLRVHDQHVGVQHLVLHVPELVQEG